MQSLLILVAPALFAATVYMILGRIIRAVQGEKHSILPLKWLTKTFVIVDILSFFVQGGGAGIMAQGKESSFHLGQKIVIAGLVIQILSFGFFITVAVVFHLRLSRHAACILHGMSTLTLHISALYVTSAIILIRNLIRVIEYAQGNNGFIISHEYMLYIFDACFILAVVVIYALIHPGRFLVAQRDSAGSMADIETQALGAVRNKA